MLNLFQRHVSRCSKAGTVTGCPTPNRAGTAGRETARAGVAHWPSAFCARRRWRSAASPIVGTNRRGPSQHRGPNFRPDARAWDCPVLPTQRLRSSRTAVADALRVRAYQPASRSSSGRAHSMNKPRALRCTVAQCGFPENAVRSSRDAPPVACSLAAECGPPRD
jgi:hypothetical protein